MPAPVRPVGAPKASESKPAKLTRSKGRKSRGQRVLLYGEGGIGKSSLAALAPNVLFCDVEDGTNEQDVERVEGIVAWPDLVGAIRDTELTKGIDTLVIDTATAAQELAIAHTVKTVPTEHGKYVKSLEGYGFGKGYRFLYETFLQLLDALDGAADRGVNSILVCHDLTEKKPNPEGVDFLQYQPNLMQTGKTCLLRDRVKGWVDHILFMQFDKAVDEAGKAEGTGTRTVYMQGRPMFWAKSRAQDENGANIESWPIAQYDGSVWSAIFNK